MSITFQRFRHPRRPVAWSCGMAAGLIDTLPSCADLLATIVADAERIVGDRLRAMIGG